MQGNKQEQWNSDRGLQKGVEALNKLRNTNDEDGEAVREFSKLVLEILSGEDGVSAAEVIQKEQAAESVRIIQQMLEREVNRV